MAKKLEKTPCIKGYTFDGNEIVVNYGLFKKERIPNTIENIKKLNIIMKNQILGRPVSSYRKDKKGTVRNTFIGMFVAFGLSLLAAPAVLVAIPSVIAGGYLYSYLSNTYKEYKASKYEFFFKNEEALNEGINNKSEITVDKIQNVNKRTVNAIMEERQLEKDVFDVNSIRKMSFNSLLNLRENLVNIKIRKQKACEQAQQQAEVVQEGNGIDAPVLKKK